MEQSALNKPLMGYPKSGTTRDSASKVNTRLLDSKSTCKTADISAKKGASFDRQHLTHMCQFWGLRLTTTTPSDATTTSGCSTRGPTARCQARRSSATPRSAKHATTTGIGAASSQMATRDLGTSSGRMPSSRKWACVRSSLRDLTFRDAPNSEFRAPWPAYRPQLAAAALELGKRLVSDY